MNEILKILQKKISITLILIVFSIPIVLPYFHKGYFPTHDGEWAVVRLGDMFRELKDFQIPPRYSGNLNFGYGYPLFNFAYPFPYYVGILFHFLRFNFVDSIKVIFALSIPLSAIFMFILSDKLWNNKLAGFISALLYLYLPYRFVDLFVRGSIGESISFIFFPLIIYSLIKIFDQPNSRLYAFLLAVSFASLILTHNIMTVLFLPTLTAFFIYLSIKKNLKEIFTALIPIIFGLLFAAFFWVPAIVEKNNILLSITPIADRNLYFVTLPQLLVPAFGYGTPTEKNGFSYQIGWPQLLVFLCVLVISFISTNKKKKFAIVSLVSFLTFFYILMMFNFTSIIWQITPLFREINYPWTMLAPIGFLITLLAGFLSFNKLTSLLGLGLAICAMVFFLPYAKPQYYVDKGDSFYLTNDATTTSSDELMPVWVKKKPSSRPNEKVDVIQGDAKLSSVNANSKLLTFSVSANQSSLLRINTIYYPGWKATINGKDANISYSNPQGVMTIAIPKGTSNIQFVFSETPLRYFSDLISVLSIFIFIVFLIIQDKLLLVLPRNTNKFKL